MVPFINLTLGLWKTPKEQGFKLACKTLNVLSTSHACMWKENTFCFSPNFQNPHPSMASLKMGLSLAVRWSSLGCISRGFVISIHVNIYFFSQIFMISNFRKDNSSFFLPLKFPRVLRGRDPILRLGPMGPKSDAFMSHAVGSVCKTSANVGECRAFLGVETCRETQNCRHFWNRVGFSRLKSANCHRDRGNPGHETQNCRFGLASGRLASKVSIVTGIRGGRGHEMQNFRHFWTCVWSPRSRVPTVTGIGGIVVAKRRTVVTFRLALGRRVSRVPTVTGIGGIVDAKRRTVVTFGFALGRRVSKVSIVTGIRGGRNRKTQNCRHVWTCIGSPRFKSANRHRDPRGRGRETQNGRHFWTCVLNYVVSTFN